MIRRNRLYQPRITEAFLSALKAGERDKEKLLACLDESSSDRACIDRLLPILRALPQSLSGYSLLDIGCANGFFTNSLAALGCSKAEGIDNNLHADTLGLQVPPALAAASEDARLADIEVAYHDLDIRDIIQRNQPWPPRSIVLFLSVLHHLVGGYGFLGTGEGQSLIGDVAAPIFKWLDEHTEKMLVFEMHEGIYADWDRQQIPGNIRALTTFTSIELIGESMGFEGCLRGLWLCSR
jgi:hypothetical protein